MKLIPIVCPKCEAQVQIEEGTERCFCTYCGTQIILHNENHKRVDTSYTYRKIDEARIREAELSQMLELKKLEIAEKKRQDRKKARKAICIVSAILIVIAFALSAGGGGDAGFIVGGLGVNILIWGMILTAVSAEDSKNK